MSPVQVTADFPGGNGIVRHVEEAQDQVRLDFAADPKNCPEPMWFHFRVTGLAGRQLRCRLINGEQTLGGADWSTNHPVYRGDDGTWERCGSPTREMTPSGRTLFTFAVPAGFGTVEFAHCYPYLPGDLEATLAELGQAWCGEIIGYSHHGRPVWRYVNDFGSDGGSRPGFYLLARQHAGETPGSWVMDGLLRCLAQDRQPCKNMMVWLVPFANIDDAIEGSYGKDPFPRDLNRAWYQLPLRTEVNAIAADIRLWSTRCRPVLLVDLHGPAHQERETYVHLPRQGRPEEVYEAVRDFACRLRQALPAQLRGKRWYQQPTYPSRYTIGTTVSAWLYDTYRVPGAGMETSYQGTANRDYTISDYHRIGAALAQVLGDLAADNPPPVQ